MAHLDNVDFKKIESPTICPECKSIAHSKTKQIVDNYKIPFKCPYCSCIKFPFQALNGIVFIWPEPLPDSKGKLLIPENIREQFKTSLGVVLSTGPGCINKKTSEFQHTQLKVGDIVAYDNSVPWKMKIKAQDGEEYDVTMANILDINAKLISEDNR